MSICGSIVLAIASEALLWYFTPPLWPLWHTLLFAIWLIASIACIPTLLIAPVVCMAVLFLRHMYVMQWHGLLIAASVGIAELCRA